MNPRRLLCRVIGHYWKRYDEHLEFGSPRLVRCRRCGYVSSLEAERGRLWDGLGGSARLDR